MPYDIVERDGRYCVVQAETGETLGCHDTRDEAEAQQAAVGMQKDDHAGHVATLATLLDRAETDDEREALQVAIDALGGDSTVKLRHAGENVWFAKLLCVSKRDKQQDRITVEEADRTEQMLRKDLQSGHVFEMGKNHEGEPTPLLVFKGIERPVADVEIDGETFHVGDVVLRFEAFHERQKSLLNGVSRGISLEGVELGATAETVALDEIANAAPSRHGENVRPMQMLLPVGTTLYVGAGGEIRIGVAPDA
jgi:hypothetical protein